VLVIQSDTGALALAVDRILPVTPAVRQGLDPFLEGMDVVRGTVNLAWRLVPLLDGRELFRRAERTSAGAPVTPPDRKSRARVLVVDDSELTRDVIVAALKGFGCDVREC